ncbi:hypothetical protein NE236_22795 [Actinoallomurus purpureus]|uniref:hypothetical protein n=1 Tax=Actinoallomurus purpureus TaxID=478114 RepID=UPI0020930916|nr:hypothetical protein [Actinoallomurus purpureus]MCO6007811.1 hypothetical protein [Actinoallomurus purpureus]
MGSRRDWRRVGAASATVSAGAVMFFAAGAGPASAESRATVRTAGECKLGPLLCSVLGGGTGKPANPPKSGGSGSTKPKPKPSAGHSHHSGSGSGGGSHSGSSGGSHSGSGGGSGSGSVNVPIAPPAAGTAGDAPQVAAPQPQGPALPDITSQGPLVYPQESPVRQEQPTAARLMAASDPAEDSVPPLLVATASGLIGAVTALNLSVLNRRLRRPRSR